MFVRLNNQTRSGLDLRHRCDLETRSEPSPPLTAWGAACEPGTIRQLTKSRQDEDLDPTPERTNLREDAIRLPAPPRDPMATGMLDDPIVSTVSRGPNPLAKCPDNLPRRPTVPFADSFHLISSPSFGNWLPQKKEEFESPQVEIETPSSVLPHRGGGPIVVANQDDRIHWLEPALQDTEEPETDRRVTASSVLIRDDPTEDAARAEDPMRFQRDLFHLIVETCIAARDSTKTAGVRAVCDVVRVRGVDHRKGGGLRRDRPGPGICAQDVRPSRHEIERDRPTTQSPSHIADRPRPRHRVHDEITGTRVPTHEVRRATCGGHAVERRVARIRMAGGLRREVPRGVGFQVGAAQHLPRLCRNHGLRGRSGRRHGSMVHRRAL